MKNKKPMQSVSGGLQNMGRPSMSKGPSTKVAERLTSMGFGKKKR